MAYIYLHRRSDTGKVFYVGKGTGDRATSTHMRNRHWHNVVNKAGFSVEIIARGLTDEEAFWAEPLLIEAHGGVENLTNMSDGGDGFSSAEAAAVSRRNWQNPEYREKKSKAMKEQMLEQWKDPAFREKRSKAAKEQMLEQWQDPAYRNERSKAWQDPAFREERSKATKEMWQDPSFREKMSKVRTKQKLEEWKDPEYRAEMRSKLARKVECDKCGRMIGVTNLPQHQRGSRCYNSDIDS